MARFAVRVEMVELVETDGAQASSPERMIWLIAGDNRDEAFDKAIAYFLLGEPKSILSLAKSEEDEEGPDA